jgi:hypothetical protein
MLDLSSSDLEVTLPPGLSREVGFLATERWFSGAAWTLISRSCPGRSGYPVRSSNEKESARLRINAETCGSGEIMLLDKPVNLQRLFLLSWVPGLYFLSSSTADSHANSLCPEVDGRNRLEAHGNSKSLVEGLITRIT